MFLRYNSVYKLVGSFFFLFTIILSGFSARVVNGDLGVEIPKYFVFVFFLSLSFAVIIAYKVESKSFLQFPMYGRCHPVTLLETTLLHSLIIRLTVSFTVLLGFEDIYFTFHRSINLNASTFHDRLSNNKSSKYSNTLLSCFRVVLLPHMGKSYPVFTFQSR